VVGLKIISGYYWARGKFMVVGQAIRQRRTSYARGLQVPPEAYRSNNGMGDGNLMVVGHSNNNGNS